MNIKTYCLCLPEYPEQIEAAKAHFKEVGLENVEFFWGINAQIAGLEGLATVHPYEVDAPGSGYRMGAKPTGCWLSHWALWSHIIRLQNETHIMIVEADAKFLPGWKEVLERALKDVPSNFDFLHPGHCCLEGHEKKHVSGDVWETKKAQCTHCYIVRRDALPFVLKTMRKIWAPIDLQMQFELFPHLNCYAIIPRLVEQFNTVIPK